MVSTEPGAPPAPPSGTKRRGSRPNPARRKAIKAKAMEGQPDTLPGNAVVGAQVDITGKIPSKEQRPSLPRRQTEPTHQNKPAIARQNSVPLPKHDIANSKRQQEPTVTKSANVRATPAMPGNGDQKTSNALALTGPALTAGGLLGCAASAAMLLGVHLWYEYAGPEQAILVAKSAKLCVDNMAEEIITSQKAGTYSSDEVLDVLRRTTLAYASTIPGGAPFVERIFQEVNMVRAQRGREVDKVLRETCAELTLASARSATAVEMQSIILSKLVKLSGFASRSVQDIVARNPRLRPYRDGVVRSIQGPPDSKVPTVQVNMAVRQKFPPQT